MADGLQGIDEPARLVEAERLTVVGGGAPDLVDAPARARVGTGAALSGWPDGARARSGSRLLATPAAVAAVDLTAIVLALLIAIRGRFPVRPVDIALFIVAYPVAVLTLLNRQVATWDDGSAIEELKRVVGAVAIPALALIGARDVVSDTVDVRIGVRLAICSLVLLLVGRLVLRYVCKAATFATRGVLIVGAGKVGSQLARGLTEAPQLGLRPVGFLDYGPGFGIELAGLRPEPNRAAPAVLDVVRSGNGSAEVESLPLLGTPDSLFQVLAQTGAECVAFAFTADGDERLLPLVEQCEQLGVKAFIIPRLFEAAGWRMQVRPVGSLPLVEFRSVDPRDVRFSIKHGLDRVVSALLLVVLAPLFAAIAALVKASSPGPVLFRQGRIGRDGREFTMFKFRSMREPTIAIRKFVPADGCAPGGVEHTDRRTRVGMWLRRTSLDELPQLINVLRGEMSMIGPRPERPEYVRRFARELRRYDRRHRVKSGITGLAQVSGLRGQTSIVERAEYDNFYVQNWSFWLDIKIALLTIKTVLSFKGE